MKKLDVSIIQENESAITVNTSLIGEDVIRVRCELDVKEQE